VDMNPVNGRGDGSNGGSTQQEPNINQSKEAQEEIINELVGIINGLFDPANLINNQYFVFKTVGTTSFELPIKWIYEERSVKAKSEDINLINRALEKAENVALIKTGDQIEIVKPKKDKNKIKLTIGLDKRDPEELKKHVYSLVAAPEDIILWQPNQSINLATVILKDEVTAADLYDKLIKTPFRGATPTCTLEDEQAYITALDNVQRKKPISSNYMYNNFQGYSPMYPQMYGYNQMMYPQMGGKPVYYQGGKKPWLPNKKSGGKFYNGKKPMRKADSKVEVNDNDFPPLDNDDPEEGENKQ